MKQPTVRQATPQALLETPLGKAGTAPEFLQRFLLLNSEVCPGAPLHIATHLIKDLDAEPEPYVNPHQHPTCDEIGLVIGQPGALEYEIRLNDEIHHVTSPGAIFIPAGTIHRARALRGNGAYVCILLDSQGPTYDNSQSVT